MYEAFFGLEQKPFNLSPDPRFLYLSEKHKEAFAHLQYAIENRTGFVMVSGEIGTGKTTICRSLLDQLDPSTELAFVFNPMLSPQELLKAINQDFGIESRGETIKELIDELNEYLLARNTEGKNCVLVVDEAQDLGPAVLEQVRLLSNLETETQKLLQIVLIGQPELAHHLMLPELRQLDQRITARYHLEPLSEAETVKYIAYRLRVAGGRGKVKFARRALRLIYKLSGGTPRMINALCDRSLLVAYTQETRDISPAVVRRAHKEIKGKRLKKPRAAPSYHVHATAPVVETKPDRSATAVAAHKDKQEPAPRRNRVSPLLLAALAAAIVTGLVWHLGIPAAQWVRENGILPGSGEAAVDEPRSSGDRTVSASSREPDDATVVTADKLTAILDGMNRDVSRNAAAKALFGLWQVDIGQDVPEGDTWEDLRAFARANGLDSTLLYPAVDQIRAINLPGFVRLATDKQSLWAGLLGVDKDRFMLTVGEDKTAVVTREAFDRHFTSEMLIVWRDPRPDGRVLLPAMRGADVKELQQALRVLGRYYGPPSGRYDEAVATAVAKIQAETGLAVDGKAGKNVRMVLSSWLSGVETPSLRSILPLSVRDMQFDSVAAADDAPQPFAEPDTEKRETRAVRRETDRTEGTKGTKGTGRAGSGGGADPTDRTDPTDGRAKPADAQAEPAGGQAKPAGATAPTDRTDLSDPTAVSGRGNRVNVQELPPPTRKQQENRQVTPPAVSTAPLVPRKGFEG